MDMKWIFALAAMAAGGYILYMGWNGQPMVVNRSFGWVINNPFQRQVLSAVLGLPLIFLGLNSTKSRSI